MQINDTTLIIPRSERRSYPPLPRFLFPCFVCALFSLCHPLHWIRGSSVCALPVMSLQCIIFQKLQILPLPVIFNLFGTTSNSVHSAHNQFSKIANFANFSYFQPFGITPIAPVVPTTNFQKLSVAFGSGLYRLKPRGIGYLILTLGTNTLCGCLV